MYQSKSDLIEDIRKLKIRVAVEVLRAYCYLDEQPFDEDDAVEELKNLIDSIDPGTADQYSILNDLLYFGVLIRSSNEILNLAIEKFPNSQFAKDCKWCIDKKRHIKESAQ